MIVYAGASFLVAVYAPEADSVTALKWLQDSREPLHFTPLHRHEVRNGIRLRAFRGEITSEQCKQAFEEIESDLADNILAHVPVPWTNTFRAAENLGALYTQKVGVRSFDLLQVGLALRTLGGVVPIHYSIGSSDE
ncbi:MAG: type II toxin-antitoxin system VapC family toxin [Verrucomicrobia bacterium]|nr:type II toxin-antitoxin system VapC family toxin [Verrucomicrobiota bacterium]